MCSEPVLRIGAAPRARLGTEGRGKDHPATALLSACPRFSQAEHNGTHVALVYERTCCWQELRFALVPLEPVTVDGAQRAEIRTAEMR